MRLLSIGKTKRTNELTGIGVVATTPTEATNAFFNISRRSNFSSILEEEEEEEEETTIEEHFVRFERDDALLFFKLLVAEDESEVGVVVTANMCTCVWSSDKKRE